ncbi:hypothetical protein GCM10027443_18400 [Pontibacter brevis]
MKNTLLTLIFLAVGAVSFAQSVRITDDGLDKVVLATNLDGLAMANLEMKQELNLTEEQFSKVERVNEQRFLQMLEAEQVYTDNEVLRSNSLRRIHVVCDQILKEVLDEQQMRHFLELEGRFHMQLISENEGE